MRKSIIALIIILAGWDSAASAQARDVSFRDILVNAAAKVSRTADRAFFEREVLQGSEGQTSSSPNTYQYSFGAGRIGGYSENIYNGKTIVTFFAEDVYGPKPDECLTLSEGEAALRSNGWMVRTLPEGVPPVVTDDISAQYQRDGVSLDITNKVDLMPSQEIWDSAEDMQKKNAGVGEVRKKRSEMTPGTDAYAGLCVNAIDIRITR